MPLAQEAFMAHVITQRCAGTCDTACVEVCPVDCIHGPIDLKAIRSTPAGERARLGLQLFIDPDECTDCGACLPECPVEAIYLDTALPDQHAGDGERNAAFFRRPG
jgi:NAD-dependent dihydropyrimidine dehydrogenase PreA subunit